MCLRIPIYIHTADPQELNSISFEIKGHYDEFKQIYRHYSQSENEGDSNMMDDAEFMVFVNGMYACVNVYVHINTHI